MVVSVDALGEDLVLLSIDPERGRIRTAQLIDYGLMGSELVRLAAARRIDIVRDWITVLDAAPTGDAELDAALQSLASARRPPRPKAWVAHRRRGIGAAYLARLTAAGTLSAEQDRTFIVRRTRWRVNDAGRLAEARARLDAAARSAGPVDPAQAAYAGLAHAIGLGKVAYPGRDNRAVRSRLEQIAKGKPPAAAADGPGNAAGSATAASAEAASAAGDVAASADDQAAIQAAVQAVVHAAVTAAVSATVNAATQAAAASAGG
jgi:Golgi phosphoprotein 3 (GPP34)